MKTLKTNVSPCHHLKTISQKTTTGLVLGSLAATATLPLTATSARADDAPSKVHALVNFEFSDHYLTPRGMDVQNHGLVFQPLVLGFFDLYRSDGMLGNVTLVGGVWNCFGTGKLASSDSNGAKNTSWYEIDPIAGISIGFAKHLTLDVTYTAFDMQIFNIPFSEHLETKLSFDDSAYLKKFAVHPYFSYWQELDGKAVSNTDANPESSYYFDLGVAPAYTFEKIGLKVEVPCRVLLPDSKFYGTGAGSSSTVGLYEVGVKGSIPLKFMPSGYGHWSLHLGFKYMGFEDDNLKATQHRSGSTQVYGGISTFF
ncbi:MAG TPA: hypothetical protein VL527_04805 [Dongiaceae bacterium]|jgi:hypothetical protein|nr:hypothetical protein [Dongiaceae bacterium]